MKEFCCLFLEFLNWNVLWKWSKFSITFVHLYQQVKLVYTYERFSVLSIKSLNQTFLPFLDRKPWWEKHILFVKQTIPHQFTLTLKGVCYAGYCTEKQSRRRGHFIGPFHHQSHEQKPICHNFLYFWHFWKKNLPYRYTKSCALQQTIDRLYPNFFQGLTKFPSLKRGWNIVLTGIFSWQMIAEGLSSYPP